MSVLRISPAPLGAARRRALEALFGPDVVLVSANVSSLAETLSVASAHDAVVLDCVRGVDAARVAQTGVLTLRPVFQEVRNRHGFFEPIFTHYVRVAPNGSRTVFHSEHLPAHLSNPHLLTSQR